MKSLNAEANPISMSIYEEMNKNNCGVEVILTLYLLEFYYFLFMCQDLTR